MSKSKRNTVDPEPIVAKYGADAVRWFMLSDTPPERDLEWSVAGIEGAARFVQRVWRLAAGPQDGDGADPALDKKVHRAVAATGEAIERLQFNKAVAQLYELATAIEKAGPSASRADAVKTLVKLASPMAPHLAEECWAVLGGEGLVTEAEWPSFDPAMLVDDQVTIAVQVNGKLRDTLNAPRGLGREEAEALGVGVGQSAASISRRRAAQGHCRSRPAGEYRRMMRLALLLAASFILSACGLRPLYGGGANSPVAASLRSIQVAPIEGQVGWLMHNKLSDRLGRPPVEAAAYRLEVELDDNITGFGIRGDRAVTRERRTLRARYRLVDLRNGGVVLDATAGSDAGIDVVSSEYATVAAEQSAVERLSEVVADQIVARLGLFAARTPPQPAPQR